MIRVLLIEDDPPAARVVDATLRRWRQPAFDLAHVTTLAGGLAGIRERKVDVVLLDLGLSDSAGLSTLERFVSERPDVAVVAVTGTDDEEVSLQALSKGAQAYLVKGAFDAGLLVRSILAAIELKRASEELRASEAKYRELIASLNDVVFEVDKGGCIAYVSPVIERVVGYLPGDLIGRPFAPLIHPDDLAKVQKAYEEGMAGRLFSSEFRLRRKDGSSVWVRTSTRPNNFGEGLAPGVRGILSDITDRKTAEDTLMRQLDELRRWQEATLGREERIAELKREVNELAARLGEPQPYASVDLPDRREDGA